ncbi:unnamed protein product, partial [Musa textilis]
ERERERFELFYWFNAKRGQSPRRIKTSKAIGITTTKSKEATAFPPLSLSELEREYNCFDLVFWVDPPTGSLIPLEQAHSPSPVLTADRKPRLRWTADLHERFADAVAQLGAPKKYRLGKQSSKETSEQSKDASCILENTSSSALSPKVPTLDVGVRK